VREENMGFKGKSECSEYGCEKCIIFLCCEREEGGKDE